MAIRLHIVMTENKFRIDNHDLGMLVSRLRDNAELNYPNLVGQVKDNCLEIRENEKANARIIAVINHGKRDRHRMIATTGEIEFQGYHKSNLPTAKLIERVLKKFHKP